MERDSATTKRRRGFTCTPVEIFDCDTGRSLSGNASRLLWEFYSRWQVATSNGKKKDVRSIPFTFGRVNWNAVGRTAWANACAELVSKGYLQRVGPKKAGRFRWSNAWRNYQLTPGEQATTEHREQQRARARGQEVDPAPLQVVRQPAEGEGCQVARQHVDGWPGNPLSGGPATTLTGGPATLNISSVDSPPDPSGKNDPQSAAQQVSTEGGRGEGVCIEDGVPRRLKHPRSPAEAKAALEELKALCGPEHGPVQSAVRAGRISDEEGDEWWKAWKRAERLAVEGPPSEGVAFWRSVQGETAEGVLAAFVESYGAILDDLAEARALKCPPDRLADEIACILDDPDVKKPAAVLAHRLNNGKVAA